jgi:Holliday junction DNA helicase RuvA
MIGYLEGQLLDGNTDAILLLAGQVGYEVQVSPFTRARVMAGSPGDTVRLYIYYHVTERQPKPVLIGFLEQRDKAFFQLFLSVSAIGPMKAVKAMIRPVGEIAAAIEDKQVSLLSKLPGIGPRTAEKIIATLHGKTREFAERTTTRPAGSPGAADEPLPGNPEMVGLVTGVLVDQLGHSPASSQRMIRAALEKNPGIQTPEALLDAIYQEGT